MPPVAVFSKLYQELKLNFEQSAEVTAEAGLDGIDCAVRDKGEIEPARAADEMPRYAEALGKHRREDAAADDRHSGGRFALIAAKF